MAWPNRLVLQLAAAAAEIGFGFDVRWAVAVDQFGVGGDGPAPVAAFGQRVGPLSSRRRWRWNRIVMAGGAACSRLRVAADGRMSAGVVPQIPAAERQSPPSAQPEPATPPTAGRARFAGRSSIARVEVVDVASASRNALTMAAAEGYRLAGSRDVARRSTACSPGGNAGVVQFLLLLCRHHGRQRLVSDKGARPSAARSSSPPASIDRSTRWAGRSANTPGAA